MVAFSLPLFKFKYVNKLLHVSRRVPTKLNGLSTAERLQVRHLADRSNAAGTISINEKQAKEKKRRGFCRMNLELMDPTQLWPRNKRSRRLRQLQQLQRELRAIRELHKTKDDIQYETTSKPPDTPIWPSETAETKDAVRQAEQLPVNTLDSDKTLSKEIAGSKSLEQRVKQEERNGGIAKAEILLNIDVGPKLDQEQEMKDGLKSEVDNYFREQEESWQNKAYVKEAKETELKCVKSEFEKLTAQIKKEQEIDGRKEEKHGDEYDQQHYGQEVGIIFKQEHEHFKSTTPQIELEYGSRKKPKKANKEYEDAEPHARENKDASGHSTEIGQSHSTDVEGESSSPKPNSPNTEPELESYRETQNKIDKPGRQGKKYVAKEIKDLKMYNSHIGDSEVDAESDKKKSNTKSSLSPIERELEWRKQYKKDALEVQRKENKYTTTTKENDAEDHEETTGQRDSEDPTRKGDKTDDTKDYFNKLKMSVLKQKRPVPVIEKFMAHQYSAKDVLEHFNRVKHYLKDFPTALSFHGARFGLDGVQIRYFNDKKRPDIEDPDDDLKIRRICMDAVPFESFAVAHSGPEDIAYSQLYSKPIKELSYRGYEVRSYCDSRKLTDENSTRIDKRKNLKSREDANRRDGDFRRLTQTVKQATFRRDKMKVRKADNVEQKPLVPSAAESKYEEVDSNKDRERRLKKERKKRNAEMTNEEDEADLEKHHRFIVNYRRNHYRNEEDGKQTKKPKVKPNTSEKLERNDDETNDDDDKQLKKFRKEIERVVSKYQLNQQEQVALSNQKSCASVTDGGKSLKLGKSEIINKTVDGSLVLDKSSQHTPESSQYDKGDVEKPAFDKKKPNQFTADEFQQRQVDKLLRSLMEQSGNTPTAYRKSSSEEIDEPSDQPKTTQEPKPIKELTYIITKRITPKEGNADNDNEPSASSTNIIVGNSSVHKPKKAKTKDAFGNEIADSPSLSLPKESPQDINDSLYKITYASISDYLKAKAGTTKNSARNENPAMSQLNLPNIASMQEFFRHPLTWEKNNGYLNLLVALGLLGYCLSTPNQMEIDDVEYKVVETDAEDGY